MPIQKPKPENITDIAQKPPEKPQLHQSHLDMIAKCGIQFQYRYGKTFGVGPEDKILPPSCALIIGSSVHKSVQGNLTSKRDTGEMLPADAVGEIARDEVEKRWVEGVKLSPEELVNPKKVHGDVIDMAVALSRLHHARVAPEINPVEIEKPFVIDLKGYPFNLAGQIDIVHRENGVKQNAKIHIRDTKTSGKTPAADAARSFQLMMYSEATRVETGSFPETASLDFLIKTKTPKHEVRTIIPDEQFVKPLHRRIENAITIIESVREGKSEFTPADPQSWVCTSKYCGYTRICPYFGGAQ